MVRTCNVKSETIMMISFQNVKNIHAFDQETLPVNMVNMIVLCFALGKSKITKILNSEENQFGKSIITWQNQRTKRIKNEWTRTVIFLTWYRHFQM